MSNSTVLEFPKPQAPESEDEGKAATVDAKIEPARVIPEEYVAADLPHRVPLELLIGALRDRRLRVTSPIHVKVTVENGHFILEAIGIDEFGYGDNLSEATVDLQRTLAELYFTLEANE